MRRCKFLIAAALAWGACAMAADFHNVKTVYLLPMAGGLDQYLAVKLTTGMIFQVVTDPLKADAIFTDHVGDSFEKSLDDLYGAVPPPSDSSTTQTFARVGGGQRSRGTYFLVDRKSRDVVWSDEEDPKGSSPTEMRRIAARVASRLSNAVKGK